MLQPASDAATAINLYHYGKSHLGVLLWHHSRDSTTPILLVGVAVYKSEHDCHRMLQLKGSVKSMSLINYQNIRGNCNCLSQQ